MVASEKAILLVNSFSNSLEPPSHLNVGLVHQIISETPVVINVSPDHRYCCL